MSSSRIRILMTAGATVGCLVSTVSTAHAEQFQMEEVGQQEQVSSPIDYVNTSSLQTSEIKLVTRGIAGTPGAGSGGGHGGEVSATLTDVSITTQGEYSPGLSAWSIGGGGGVATTPTVNGLLKLVHTSSAINGSSGHGGNINIRMGKGSIRTAGARSYGIQAQSIGGGGGSMSYQHVQQVYLAVRMS